MAAGSGGQAWSIRSRAGASSLLCRTPRAGVESSSGQLWVMLAAMRRASSSSERRKKDPKGETAWGPEVLQFRLWAEQRGRGGMGEPPGPPKLRDSTAHAPAETITPLYSTEYLFVSFSGWRGMVQFSKVS
jgi:hypothetical protein